jgi:hypothetical protein
LGVRTKRDSTQERRGPKVSSVWLRFFIGFFLVIILVGGVYSSYLFYAAVREIVAHTEMPALPMLQFASFPYRPDQSDLRSYEEPTLSQLPEMPEA